MKRRTFLRNSVAAAGAFLLDNPLAPRFRFASAQAAGVNALVVVFQRGGCDGLNTVVPYAEMEYYNLRSSIAIAPPDPADRASAIEVIQNHHGRIPIWF